MDSRVCIREHVSVGEEARRVRELVGCMCDMKKTASVSVRERERERERESMRRILAPCVAFERKRE